MKMLPTLMRLIIFCCFFNSITSFAQWSEVLEASTPIGYKRQRITFTNDSVGYFQTTYGLYKTLDAGLSWTLIDAGSYERKDFDVIGMDTVYSLVTGTGSNVYIRRSTDGGATWEEIPAPAGMAQGNGAIHFTSGTTGYASGVSGYVFKTTDAGVTWETVAGLMGAFNEIFFVNDSIGYAAGADGKVWRTVNSGLSWEPKTVSTNSLHGIFFLDENTGFVSATYEIFKTTDGGNTWVKKGSSPGTFASIHFPSADTGYVSGSPVFARTTDGGETWIAMEVPDDSTTAYNWIWDVFFTSNDTGYITGDGAGKVYKTTVAAFSCPTIDAGKDFKSCVGQSTLLPAAPSVPNNYKYAWSPATDLDDPFIQQPTVTPSTAYQTITYQVVMSDTLTGCPDLMDSITIQVDTVLNYEPLPGGPTFIIPICPGDTATVDLGPGGLSYLWSGGSTLVDTQVFSTASPASYNVTVNSCGIETWYIFHFWQVSACDSVWPGDANYDLRVATNDLFEIGLNFGTAVYPRSAISNDWAPHFAENSGLSPNGIDIKHSNCNGDGIVDFSDTVAVSLNYGKTRPLKTIPSFSTEGLPDLKVKAAADTVAPGSIVTLDVILADPAMPVDSIYGITFTINFDPAVIDSSSTSVLISNSWMGSEGIDLLTLKKMNYPQGNLDLALVRNSHTNAAGEGKIASFTFKVSDLINSKQNFSFTVSNVEAITEKAIPLSFNAIAETLTIDPALTIPESGEDKAAGVSAFPVPVSSIAYLTVPRDVKKIVVRDITGREVRSLSNPGSSVSMDLSDQLPGWYSVSAESEGGTSVTKLLILR